MFHQTWTTSVGGVGAVQYAPLAAVANGISAAAAGPNTATANSLITGSLAVGGKVILDVARSVLITVTHATSIVAVSGITTGYDIDNQLITEAWTITATGTSKTAGGAVSFKVVSGVTVTAAADATANTVTVGTNATLGLDVTSTLISPVKELTDGVAPTAGVLVASSAAANKDRRGLYTPNLAPNGARLFDVWYISDDPWNS